MVLLRRRNWTLTLASALITLSAYAALVYWVQPGFMERHYYAKQRWWAQFLASCDCEGEACHDSFNLNMMHGSLYDRLMTDSGHGNRSVVKHLVWQPYKVVAAYPWRLRMYAHMGLVLPRSLALLHSWWLVGSEELALALQHLSQGVPLVLDPDSASAERVEPDASMLCKLEKGEEEEEEAAAGGQENVLAPTEAGNMTVTATTQQEGGGDGSGSGGGHSGFGSGPADPAAAGGSGGGGDAVHNRKTGGGAGRGGGGKRQRRAAGTADSEGDSTVRLFVCTLYDTRGAGPLLRLLQQPGRKRQGATAAAPPPPPQQQDNGFQLADAPAAVLPPPPPPASSDAPGAEPGAPAELVSYDGGSSGDGEHGPRQCRASDGKGSCPAPPEWGATAGTEVAIDEANVATSAVGEPSAGNDAAPLRLKAAAAQAPSADGGSANGSDAGGGGAADGGKDSSGFRERRRPGGGSSGGGGFCRNMIYVRPPHRSEVSEHVRELEASPLGLTPLELLRATLPRVAELAGWLLLPYVMLGQYVLLLAPLAESAPGPSGHDGSSGGGEYGTEMYGQRLATLSIGLQLMLAAGALLTMFELQLWARVVSELISLRRPGRSWSRRREAAWRLLYEGMLQPLREALLSWNVTHFVGRPLLQLVLSVPSLDVALMLPLLYCVLMLGAANVDVAARATPALLRVARRTRRHEGGFHLLLVNVVMAAEPKALPYIVRLLHCFNLLDPVGNAGRAAVVAATLEEAPGMAAALAAEPQQRGRQQVPDGGDGGGGGGGELAAAMQALVAPAAAAMDADRGGARHRPRGAGGVDEDLYDSEDEEEDEEAEGAVRGGRPVGTVLRWPAPLQLPPEVHDWEDVPRGFTCAITQQLMTQPAMLVSPDLPSAPTYERAAIQQWLAGQMRDPKSNTPLRCYSLLPNEDLHRAIDDWVGHQLRAAQQRTAARKSGLTRRPQAHHDTGVVDGTADGAAGTGAGFLPEAAAAVDDNGAKSSPYSGDESESYSGSRSRSGNGGGGGGRRSTSVLASLAHGASSLMDTGVEVMSRAAAAAAAAAVAVAAATAGGGIGGGLGPPSLRDDGSTGEPLDRETQEGGGGGSAGRCTHGHWAREAPIEED